MKSILMAGVVATILALSTIIYVLSVNRDDSRVITLPLLINTDKCVDRYLQQIPFARYGSYEIENFTNQLPSHPSVIGMLRIQTKKDKKFITPIINSILHDCYPEELTVGRINPTNVSEFENAIELITKIQPDSPKRIYVEVDLKSGNFLIARREKPDQ